MSSRDYVLAALRPTLFDKHLPGSDFTPVISIPEMQRNGFMVEHKTLKAGYPYKMLRGGFVQYDEPTTVTVLKHKKKIWMSNSPSEVQDMKELAGAVEGERVLVAGLGLGVLVHLLCEDGKEVTVVEISSDLCEMVRPYLPKGVTLVNADFRKWILEQDLAQFYDYSILDIWADISSDDLLDMCELYQQVGLPGGVWGLGPVVRQLNEVVCGYENPDAMADKLEMEDFADLAEYVWGNYDVDDYCSCGCEGYDCDGEVWSEYEEGVLHDAIFSVYGIQF